MLPRRHETVTIDWSIERFRQGVDLPETGVSLNNEASAKRKTRKWTKEE
jgi:hypothetical protein